jgi:predicted transposase YdaD
LQKEKELIYMSKRKNPVIEKAFENGKKEGYLLGLSHGEEKGIQKATNFFADKLEGLPKTPGIGPKTLKKLKRLIGEQYFSEVDEIESERMDKRGD